MQNKPLADASLDLARQHLGIKEATGHNDGPFVQKIQEWYAGPREHGAPWCALFATWCIHTAAATLLIKPLIPKSDSSTELYAFGHHHGLILEKPIPGCLGLIKGNGGTPGKTHHHTFRVVEVSEAAHLVSSLDGNWGNAVAQTTHRISDCDFMSVC